MTFGIRILWTIGYIEQQASGDMKANAVALGELAQQMLLGWLNGDRFTDQADEDELRAIAALDAMEAGGGGLVRLAAKSVLRLPPGHRLRDLGNLAEKLLASMETSRQKGEWLDFVLIGEMLLADEVLDPARASAVAEQLVEVADAPPQTGEPLDESARREAYVAAAAWHVMRSIALRDADDLAGAAAHRERFAELSARGQAIERSPAVVVIEAMALEEGGRSEEAADLLAPLSDSDGESRDSACWLEGMIRLGLGHYARSIEVLERVVPGDEARYLLATSEAEIESEGERFGKDATNLAFGYAYVGQWAKGLETLDRAKNPRMRHVARLRQSEAGKELLALEARLASAARGAPGPQPSESDHERDPLGARLSSATRALEGYRRARPDLGSAHLAPPSVAEVGAMLDADEALVCLASSFKGLLVGVILPGDDVEPSGKFLLEELPGHKVVELMFTSEEMSGWALELAALDPIDPEPALEAFIARCDAAFGKLLADFLGAHGVRRVTIVPHRLLHFVPFWALPSLVRFDVRTARSAAQWREARSETAPLAAYACIVGNPTLDLPLATAEAESVGALLERRGCAATVLLQSAAREAAIRDSLRGGGILHFAGHGIARPLEPLHSALLTHPDEKWGWPLSGDPLGALASDAGEWVGEEGGTRFADLALGRLVEERDEDGSVVERRLEHAGSGTLWGRYHEGQLLQLSELWTASDMLTENALADCSLAFLVACQSGQPAFQTEMDEDLSIPGALQLAGVRSVVCTLWPVQDVTALVFSAVFYRQLVALPKGPADLAKLVAGSRAALAGMHRDAAADLLRETLAHTTGRGPRAQIEYVIRTIGSGPERPFAHPYQWAAFFTQGAARIEIPWA